MSDDTSPPAIPAAPVRVARVAAIPAASLPAPQPRTADPLTTLLPTAVAATDAPDGSWPTPAPWIPQHLEVPTTAVDETRLWVRGLDSRDILPAARPRRRLFGR